MKPIHVTIIFYIFILVLFTTGIFRDYSTFHYFLLGAIFIYLLSLSLHKKIFNTKSILKHTFYGAIVFCIGFLARPATVYEKKNLSIFITQKMIYVFKIRLIQEISEIPSYIEFIQILINEQAVNEEYKKGNTELLDVNKIFDKDYILSLLDKQGNVYKPVVFLQLKENLKKADTLKKSMGFIQSSLLTGNFLQSTDDESRIKTLKEKALQQKLGNEENLNITNPDFILSLEIESSRVNPIAYRGKASLQKNDSGVIVKSIEFFGENEANLYQLTRNIPYYLFMKPMETIVEKVNITQEKKTSDSELKTETSTESKQNTEDDKSAVE